MFSRVIAFGCVWTALLTTAKSVLSKSDRIALSNISGQTTATRASWLAYSPVLWLRTLNRNDLIRGCLSMRQLWNVVDGASRNLQTSTGYSLPHTDTMQKTGYKQ